MCPLLKGQPGLSFSGWMGAASLIYGLDEFRQRTEKSCEASKSPSILRTTSRPIDTRPTSEGQTKSFRLGAKAGCSWALRDLDESFLTLRYAEEGPSPRPRQSVLGSVSPKQQLGPNSTRKCWSLLIYSNAFWDHILVQKIQ